MLFSTMVMNKEGLNAWEGRSVELTGKKEWGEKEHQWSRKTGNN